MQLHQLKPIHKNKSKKRIGRGGKRGTFSGRGVKGQKSRAGARIRPDWRDLIKKIPKKRGAYFKPIKKKPAVVNLSDLQANFKDGETLSKKTLIEKGLVGRIKGKVPAVKILAKGELTRKLTVRNLLLSKSAEAKIKKAGGQVVTTKHK